MSEIREGGAAAPVKQSRQQAKRRRSAGTTGSTARAGAVSASASTPPHSGGSGRTVKKSVTLSERVAEEIEARTGARGFSRFLDAAAERYLALLKAQELLDDHTSRLGDFTADELAEAEAAWRGE